MIRVTKIDENGNKMIFLNDLIEVLGMNIRT